MNCKKGWDSPVKKFSVKAVDEMLRIGITMPVGGKHKSLTK
jgi:hypothetical protein